MCRSAAHRVAAPRARLRRTQELPAHVGRPGQPGPRPGALRRVARHRCLAASVTPGVRAPRTRGPGATISRSAEAAASAGSDERPTSPGSAMTRAVCGPPARASAAAAVSTVEHLLALPGEKRGQRVSASGAHVPRIERAGDSRPRLQHRDHRPAHADDGHQRGRRPPPSPSGARRTRPAPCTRPAPRARTGWPWRPAPPRWPGRGTRRAGTCRAGTCRAGTCRACARAGLMSTGPARPVSSVMTPGRQP